MWHFERDLLSQAVTSFLMLIYTDVFLLKPLAYVPAGLSGCFWFPVGVNVSVSGCLSPYVSPSTSPSPSIVECLPFFKWKVKVPPSPCAHQCSFDQLHLFWWETLWSWNLWVEHMQPFACVTCLWVYGNLIYSSLYSFLSVLTDKLLWPCVSTCPCSRWRWWSMFQVTFLS